MMEFITKKLHIFYQKFYDSLKTSTLYIFIFDSTDRFIFQRIIIGYVYGSVLGYSFWSIFIENIGLSLQWSYIIMGVLMICLGIGYAFYTQVRCITLLVCLGFFGRAGRHIAKAFILSLIITGPLNNILINSGEVIRTFACSTSLTYNLSKTRFDLMTHPFHHALMGMKDNISHVKDAFKSVEDVIEPIVIEVEGEDLEITNYSRRSLKGLDPPDKQVEDVEFYQRNYMEKMEKRCRMQIEKGAGKCRNAFQTAHDKCYDKLPVIVNSLLCWPMKINFVCDIGKSLGLDDQKSGPCNPSNVIEPEFGENYSRLKTTEEMLIGNFSDVNIDYKTVSVEKVPGLETAEATSKNIKKEFNAKKSVFEQIMFFVNKILAFVFLKVIYSAISYHRKYLHKIEYDNIFITDYFCRIDHRRKKRRVCSLFPLKKIEKQNTIDPKSTKRISIEYRGLILQIIKILLELITATCFVLLDRLFYESLDLITRHAKIDYTQEGVHDVTITVDGNGIIAAMVRAAISGFSSHHEIKSNTTNKLCLPKPSHLSRWIVFKIFATYFLTIVLIFQGVYIQRLRHIFCGFFYPKREKRRTLYLYNKLIKRRKKLFQFMSQNIKEKLKEKRIENKTNIIIKLRIRYPKYFGWLRYFTIARRKCIICNEPEPSKRDYTRPFHFMACSTPNCDIVHCDECWTDIGEICLACHKYTDYTSGEVTHFSDFYRNGISE